MSVRQLKQYFIILFILAVTIIWLLIPHQKSYESTAPYYLNSSFSINSTNQNERQIACKNSSSNFRNAIAFLCSPDNFLNLPILLNQLDVQLADNCSSAILLFHTGYPSISEMSKILSSTCRCVIVRNVDQYLISLPDGFNPYHNEPIFSKRGKWNYHQMIRFWFKFVFELNETQSFDYVMRIDTDSQLIGKWINVFQLMKTENLVYIANDERVEYEKTLPGTMKLKEFMIDYQKRMKLVAVNQRKVDSAFTEASARIYYNNFEVFQTKFFRQPKLVAWINAIDATHGIFKYRWGDAMLRYITLALFARDDQIAHRAKLDLPYCHPC